MLDVISICPIDNVQIAVQIQHAGDAAGANIYRGGCIAAIGCERDGGLEGVRGCIEGIVFELSILQIDQCMDDRTAIIYRIHGDGIAGLSQLNGRGKIGSAIWQASIHRWVYTDDGGRLLVYKDIQAICIGADDLVRDGNRIHPSPWQRQPPQRTLSMLGLG